jgi:hypothetical protein
LPWKLTVRSGPRVKRSRYSSLEETLDALRVQAQELSDSAPRRAVNAKIKSFEPVQQVFARLELAGPQRLSPSVQAGIDVRGDGSTEAFLGRIRRQIVEPGKGEDAYQALTRAVHDRLG